MDAFFDTFKHAHVIGSGYQISETLLPLNTSNQPNRLISFYRSTNFQSVKTDIEYQIKYDNKAGLSKKEIICWVDIYVAYWKAVGEILKAEAAARTGALAQWSIVYESWKEVTNAVYRGYTNGEFEAWTVPCMYVVSKYLRIFAIKADVEIIASGKMSTGLEEEENPEAGKNQKLEDAARTLNRFFQLCLADRAPLEVSRKWGIYNIVNLLFKTYFKLGSVSLSKNIINALKASKGDMPELESFPKAHQVTYKYYVGVIAFLDENYAEAQIQLTEAWQLCHRDAIRNQELILTYLIPCRLLTTHTLPGGSLLARFPRLRELFSPLAFCIKKGDLSGFDAALFAGEDEFVKRRIYLTLERGRDIALRNLLRRVFLAGGIVESTDGAPPARKAIVPIAEFGAAISVGSKEQMDNDEVECLIANLIYKNLMKGYISRQHGKVVLSKKGDAFPGTGV